MKHDQRDEVYINSGVERAIAQFVMIVPPHVRVRSRIAPIESTVRICGEKALRLLLRVSSHCEVHNLADHLSIGEAGFSRGIANSCPLGANGFWIGFDDIKSPLAGLAHVDAAIIAKLHGA